MNQYKVGKFIAECRKEKKLTQEGLAEKLGVSYKSVSKWENGICLPNPSLYDEICNIFNISKDELLNGDYKEKKYFKKVEFIILILSIIIMFIAFLIPNILFRKIVLSLLFIVVIIVFNKNIYLLTRIDKNNSKIKKIKIFNYFLIIIIIIFSVLSFFNNKILNNDTVSLALVSIFIIIGGLFLNTMPFNRYIGLRLPWTIRDKSTWELAHNILYYISIPIGVLVLIFGLLVNVKISIIVGIITWIMIPSIISGYHYYKKFIGLRK